MSEGIIVVAWSVVGILGGWRINRTEQMAREGWIMAAILGPFTLALGMWEWLSIRSRRKHKEAGK